MTKTNIISILLITFLIVLLLLSGFGILGLHFTEILYYLIIAAGTWMVYTGVSNRSKPAIFIGTGLFIVGVLLLVNQNFNVKTEIISYLPFILMTAAAGYLLVFISDSAKKLYIVISLALFALSMVLIPALTVFEIDNFLKSILPLLKVYWPAAIILLLIIILLRNE